LDVTIVLPESAPPHKVAAVRALGVTVRIVPPAQRESATLALRDELDAFLIRSDDFDVIAGAGTVGLEITEQLSDVDVVLLPVCSGSLLSGTAVAVKALAPHAKVIGVEPELAADAAESFRAGRRIAWTTEQTYRTVADGLRVPVVGELAWEHIHRYVDDIVTVTEDDILAAVQVLATRLGVRAEPSGAVTTAARLFHADALPAGTTVAVVSGGNVPTQESL
jgi:threonine dehydratase